MAPLFRIVQVLALCGGLLTSTVSAKPVGSLATPESAFSIKLSQHKNPSFGRNGPRDYSRALLKYGAELPGHLSRFATNENVAPIGPLVAHNTTSDREYVTSLDIGTPPQSILFDLDTGSADTWVLSTETMNPLVANRSLYDPSKSSTAKRVTGNWTITYGDGSMADGAVFSDRVRIGPITLNETVVESASYISNTIAKDLNIGGIVGLAFNHSSTVRPAKQNLLADMYARGYNTFSVDLQYHAPGAYYFGPVDDSLYEGSISYQPVYGASQFWTVDVTTLQIGGTNIERVHAWPMIVDTGTSLGLLPDEFLEEYYAEVPGGVFSEYEGGWIFPCNETMPELIWGFANDGSKFTVPSQYLNYAAVNETMCFGGLQSNQGMPFSLVGDMMIKSCFVVFDGSKPAVGFAQKKSS